MSFLDKAFGRDLHTAAALGDVARVQQAVQKSPQELDRTNKAGTARAVSSATGRERFQGRRRLRRHAMHLSLASLFHADHQSRTSCEFRSCADVVLSAVLPYHCLVLRSPQDGQTALHLAAANGFDAVVRELLARQAKTTVQDKTGSTALHLAAAAGQTSCVSELLGRSNRDSMDAKSHLLALRDREGHDALMAAVVAGREGAVRKLLEVLGPQARTCVDKTGCGPLLVAVQRQHVHLLPLLASAPGGPDRERDPSTGCTALHLAARRGHLAAIDCLLRHGASTSTRDNTGRSAAELALAEGQPAAYRALKEAAAASAAAGVSEAQAGLYDHRLLQRVAAAELIESGSAGGLVMASGWGQSRPGSGPAPAPGGTGQPAVSAESRLLQVPLELPRPVAYPQMPEGAGVYF